MIYLDNSATTRVMPAAIAAVASAMDEEYYNPSSAYGPAVKTERLVDAAREEMTRAMGVTRKELIFTSGGTESNNMAVFGTRQPHGGKGQYITTTIEHPSVYEPFRVLEEQGKIVHFIGVRADGVVSLEELEQALTPDTVLVSMMHVNNETGAINDIASAYTIIKRIAPQAVLHVDGVQAFLKMPMEKPPTWDLYSISGHKFHGPKGVGGLFARSTAPLGAGQIGGGQEDGRRSGTTNTPGILGMHAAFVEYTNRRAVWVDNMHLCKLRLAKHLAGMQDVQINGPKPEDGAPHILNASFLGVRGEVLLNSLSEKGVYVSTGSACSAKKKGKSRILTAMGLSDKRQEGAIRFSLCPQNTIAEMDEAASIIQEAVVFLRKYQRR